MTVRIQCVNFDCQDPATLSGFWRDALGWRQTQASTEEVVLEPPQGSPEEGISPDLLFIRVPESKAAKNRLHIDLRPEDQTAEVERLRRLGAREVNVGQSPTDSWVVMADPEGNEFCVLAAYTPEQLASLAH